MANDIIIRIRADSGQFDSDIARAQARLNQLSGTSRNASDSMGILSNSTKALQTRLTQLGVGFSLANVIREILTTGQTLDGITASFTATFGSNGVGRELDYTRKVANDLGLEVTSLQASYSKWAAAAKGTSLEGEQQKKVFEAVAQASRVLNLSVDDTEGTLRALSQMISKGKVQAEELRGQLGERLPGAYAMAARAMGVTQAELGKMMEQGKLMAENLLPKLAIELNKTYGGEAKDKAVHNLASETNRLKNSITDLYTAIYSNVSDELAVWARTGADAFKNLTNHVGLTLVPLTMLGTYFAGKGLASLTSYIGAIRASSVATQQQNVVNQARLANTVRLTEAQAIHTQGLLAQAQATVAATSGFARLSVVQSTLIPAHQRAAAAAAAHTAALEAQKAALAANSLMARTMSGALALIGGPLGAAVIGIGALTYGIVKAKEANDHQGKSIVDLNGNYVRYADVTRTALSLNAEYLKASADRRSAINAETAKLKENTNAELADMKAKLAKLQANYDLARQASAENSGPQFDDNGNIYYPKPLTDNYDKDIKAKKAAIAELELQISNLNKVEAANAAGQEIAADSLKLSTEAYDQQQNAVKQNTTALIDQTNAIKKASDALLKKLDATRSLITDLVKQRIELQQGAAAAEYYVNRLKGLGDTEARLAGEANKYNTYLAKRNELMDAIGKASGGRGALFRTELKSANLNDFDYTAISQQTDVIIQRNERWQKSVEGIGKQAEVAEKSIKSLISTAGTKTRVYENNDGTIETRQGGTASWRNNNPGNLKFEYAGSADNTVQSIRSKEKALLDAQKRYEQVIDLDQYGNAIFATEAAGREAQARLLTKLHGMRTIEQMLPKYAISDYSGKANVQAYANKIYSYADSQGANLHGRTIGSMSASELSILTTAMKSMEGWKEGTVSLRNNIKDISTAVQKTTAATEKGAQAVGENIKKTQQRVSIEQAGAEALKAQQGNLSDLTKLGNERVGQTERNNLDLLDQQRYTAEQLKSSKDQLDTTRLTGKALLEQRLIYDEINPSLAKSISQQAALADYTEKQTELRKELLSLSDPHAAYKAELDKTRMDDAQKLSILMQKQYLDYAKVNKALSDEIELIGKNNIEKQKAQRISQGMSAAYADELSKLEQKKLLLEEEDRLLKEKDQIAAIGEKAKYKLGLTQNGMDDKTAASKAAEHMGNLYQSRLQELKMQRQEILLSADAYNRLQLEVEGYNAAQINSMATQQKANEKLAELKKVGEDVYAKIQEGLIQTIMTGKADWSGLVNYIIQEALRLQVIKPLMDALFGQGGSNGSWLMRLFGGKYANGGAFSGGVQMFATGGVVSSPTAFGMSGGKMGIMGEAGPEAIMPLTRTAGGALGVRMETPILPAINVIPQIILPNTQAPPNAASTNNQAMPAIKVELINQSGQPIQARQSQASRDNNGNLSIKVMIDQIKSAVASDIREGGSVREAVADTFNLRPAIY